MQCSARGALSRGTAAGPVGVRVHLDLVVPLGPPEHLPPSLRHRAVQVLREADNLLAVAVPGVRHAPGDFLGCELDVRPVYPQEVPSGSVRSVLRGLGWARLLPLVLGVRVQDPGGDRRCALDDAAALDELLCVLLVGLVRYALPGPSYRTVEHLHLLRVVVPRAYHLHLDGVLFLHALPDDAGFSTPGQHHKVVPVDQDVRACLLTAEVAWGR